MRYAGEREAFGQAIGKNQAIQFMIADMEVRASTARLAYYRAAEKMLRGEPYGRVSSGNSTQYSFSSRPVCGR